GLIVFSGQGSNAFVFNLGLFHAILPVDNHKGRFYKPFVMTLPLPAVTLQLVGSRAKATL
ncbi:MAG: hypothetical protein ACFNM7_04785, partial [Prevotella conceptionensis]